MVRRFRVRLVVDNPVISVERMREHGRYASVSEIVATRMTDRDCESSIRRLTWHVPDAVAVGSWRPAIWTAST